MREVEVHLVRHGQSTWNVEGRLQGQTAHPPLTDKGRADAARAAAQLTKVVGHEAVAIVSSDLVRASQTADIIESTLTASGAALVAPVCITEALREQHLGSMQGRLTKDLRPEPVPEGRHIGEIRWSGGESLADVHMRLDRYFRGVLPNAPMHLVVVTHGDTLRVARAVLSGRNHRDVEWDVVTNGTVISIACRVDGPAHLGNHDRRPRSAGLPTGAGNG